VGLYVRKAKQSWYSVRGEIERELAADELKSSLKRAGDSVREVTGSIGAEVSAARAEAMAAKESVESALPKTGEPPAA